jgi:hypothetical protein
LRSLRVFPPWFLSLFGTILDKKTHGIQSEGMVSPKQNLATPSAAALPARKGRRQTEQRRAVFDALMAKADHPPLAVDLARDGLQLS